MDSSVASSLRELQDNITVPKGLPMQRKKASARTSSWKHESSCVGAFPSPMHDRYVKLLEKGAPAQVLSAFDFTRVSLDELLAYHDSMKPQKQVQTDR
ncbi:unnamed protein product [Vitrella brassicaformis CCMP3155]|uniref:Uncharacterized protein n=1 Tax=Vitrella brassicaformis (strain CCMP3155) TaxID=1169540 RepID=A0A0G4F6Y6_VITBC|nr:unnamed protein product [Vitrella brassicaformis CCMP3155]|eukprot:CEM08316.1 unnamed protein product [Vitrella brassicaformis CCMP3155]